MHLVILTIVGVACIALVGVFAGSMVHGRPLGEVVALVFWAGWAAVVAGAVPYLGANTDRSPGLTEWPYTSAAGGLLGLLVGRLTLWVLGRRCRVLLMMVLGLPVGLLAGLLASAPLWGK